MPVRAEPVSLIEELRVLRLRVLRMALGVAILPVALVLGVLLFPGGRSALGVGMAGGAGLLLSLALVLTWQRLLFRSALDKGQDFAYHMRTLHELTARLPELALYRLCRDESGAWHFEFVSEGVEALLGSPPEALCRDFDLFLSHFEPSSRMQLRRALQAPPRPDVLLDMELCHYAPRGGMRWLQTRARVRSDQARRLCCEGILLDITDRKQAEDLLRQKENRSRELFENARDLVWVHDEAGRFVAMNRAFRHILGQSPSRLTGSLVEELLAEEYRPAFRRQFQTLKRTSSESAQLEVEMLERDGGRRPVEILIRMVPEDGDRCRCHCIGRDLSERLEAEAELRRRAEELARSNAELERFAYAASHDLQEPLRSIAGYIQLIERRCGDGLDERARRYIGNSVAAVKRMQALIHDLLEYSRLSSRPRCFAQVDLAELLRSVRENLRGAIAESGAEIVCGPLPTVLGDATQLHRLFQNLLGNAIKFRAPDRSPRVRIQAWQCPAEPGTADSRRAALEFCREKGWLFCVEDDGIGIAEEHFERIFQIFQRLHTREEFDGTGMGLAICQKIVQSHGGVIWPEQRIDGQGIRLFVFLPWREKEDA